MNVILSIKPEFVEKIFSGEKRFEYRKSAFRRPVEKVYIYSCMPVGRIVGEFQIEKVISDSPSNLWKVTKEYSGIDEEFFISYYSAVKKGVAIKIKSPIKYKQEINPFKIWNSFKAPQSYIYIDQVMNDRLEYISVD